MPLPGWLARSNKHLANRVIGPFAPHVPGLGVVHHVGRRSGRTYSTPVNVFRDSGDYIIVLTYGQGTDWEKNVRAAGGCELTTRGRRIRLTNPRIETDREKVWAWPPVRFVLGRIDVNHVLRLTPS